MQIDWSMLNTAMNLVLIVGSGMIGHFMKGLNDRITDLKVADQALSHGLRTADSELNRRIAAIELLIAGQYVTRSEFKESVKELSDALFRKLDAIDDKLDHKVDKS